ncbi:hypothetical protein KCU71_g177, partial [Aureobasidium melanogenum]
MDDKLPYTFQTDAYWTADPEEIESFGHLVVACAEGHLSPFAAAQKITDELASDAWRNKAYIELHNEDRPYRTHTVLVAVLIGSCASAFPPRSVVHDRLLAMIKIYSRRFNKSQPIRASLGKLTAIVLCIELDHEQQRWRNLSYFSARIAIHGIERMGRQSPLQNLLPKYRALDEDTVGWSGHLAGQALAAAQWFVPKGHASWVWRACCVCETYSQLQASSSRLEQEQTARMIGNHEAEADETAFARLEGWLWNLQNWDAWKAAFTQVTERVGDQRIHEVVRREASEALKSMEEVETIGEHEQYSVKHIITIPSDRYS